jgi:hypothetical protein
MPSAVPEHAIGIANRHAAFTCPREDSMHRCATSSSHRLLTLALFLLLSAAGSATAAGETAPAASGALFRTGAAERLFVASSPPAGDAQPGIRVIAAEEDCLQIEFTLPALTTQTIEIDGETFHLLEIDGGGVNGTAGEPMLPTFSRLIQIPDQSGVTFEITSVESSELTGYRPFPMQPDGSGEFVINRAAYEQTGFLESNPARIAEPAIARDLRVVPITFSPVRYDPSRDVIEVASRITVTVRFAGVDLRNAKTHHHDAIPPSFDRLYRNLVVNYEGPREGQSVSPGSYVLICPNNQSVVDALQPLVEWRTRKGFEVYLATTAETGTSASQIQSWLRNAYNTWENPPEYITLVGDTGGTIGIPSWGNSDHEYTQLDGGDVVSEAHIGRISVDSLDRLRLYMTKIVGYESTPYMDDTDWYTRACLTGDPSSSGITTIQIMQWLKIQLLERGYTEVDTIFSYPWVNQMTTALNRGDTVFSYRGYIGMSGFGTGDIYALQNGWKMPYAVNLTCATGNFDGSTSRSEAWIRAGIPPDTPTGGIASVATATSGTHTRYNNCMMYGIWRGIFWDGMYTFGESLTRGKYELYVNYIDADPGAVSTWSRYNNLMGDSAGECWTGVPETMTVSRPLGIPIGTNSVTVSVEALGAPLADAYVCLWKDDETHIGACTRADGTAELLVNAWTQGQMLITVTKHDYHPYLSTIPVSQADHFVGYMSHRLDDDMTGESSGNGDGVANPTEELEIPVRVCNYGTQTAYDVTGTLTCDDAYVTILDDYEEFGDIDAGWTAWGDDDFGIAIDGATPNGHVIRLGLDLQSGAGSWHSLIDIPVVAAEFAYDDITLYDLGGELDPGEEGEISVRILNTGGAEATAVTGTLTSQSGWVVVTDAGGTFGNIGIDATGENTGDRFAIRAEEDCFEGHLAAMVLYLEFSGGARDTVHLLLSVGTASSTDPTGPDNYGYWAFDNSDTGYEQAPTYQWVEIAPNHGGPGTDVGLTDFGGTGDDSRTVDLPFPFTYYGRTFTRTTICSNGWMSMGATYLSNRRNWNIPAVGAPDYLIAPMWDDLYQSGSDRVYEWHDAANHRYIVQWSRVRNNNGGGIENFQVILHDPAHYPTATGDGEIIFQFDMFANTDHVQHYSTTGIENGDQTDGVMYGYFNRYNAGAATITSGRAIKFTPIVIQPRGTLSGTVVNATNGDTPLAGATIEIAELGEQFTSGANGGYGGVIPVGTYTLIADHVSFAPDTVESVLIAQGETTDVDFALVDDAAPAFSQTTHHPNSGDDTGPYAIYTTVTDYSEVTSVLLFYRVRAANWIEVPMTPLGGPYYRVEIPGQSYGALIEYYLQAQDAGGLIGIDPRDAPESTYEFWVLEPLLGDDFEAGTSEWAHYIVTNGFSDQWHLSTQRNHTTLGTWSWKFGTDGPGDYDDYADGALETVPIELTGDPVTLTFWHWIDAELDDTQPGYAFDGGVVEISIDGGEWIQITPFGGYPYRIVAGDNPGPFPAETPVYSGSRNWIKAHFDLEDLSGSARLRFRFGSDGSNGQEGWYIDDVEILPDGPGLAGADDPQPLPRIVALYQNVPNPFGAGAGDTRIRFDLPQASPVQLQVMDASGRLVRSLVSRILPPGHHEIGWNGRDPRGRPVAAGVYFYVLQTGERQLARRLLLVR